MTRDHSRGFVPYFTTPLQARKRSAPEVEENTAKRYKLIQTPSTSQEEKPQLPPSLNTPPLTTMDSDDEFNSGMSSQEEEDFGGTQESGDDSFEEGEPFHVVLCKQLD